MEVVTEILDLSGKKIKKLSKLPPEETQNVTTLILDDNELQRLDNIDSFVRLQKLSVVRNQLLRMYGICRLHALHTVNLAHNGILTIEGLKELVNLKWLCLAGNNIKTIEHLNTSTKLEHLDLSENSIIHINDVSFLKNLKELFLHNNKINHLVQCDRFLPVSLTHLTLANNNINDLNEISQLVHLVNLTSISIANNPCVNMSGKSIGFDYRPFVINWLMNVTVIDGYVVDAIESLRAEWLYSQGRGRHFRIGDQNELAQYLASVCPLTGEALETEEDRKLRLILSKAQQHQRQLRDQESNGELFNSSPMSRKKLSNSKNLMRPPASRCSNKSRSPDRMSSSCYSSNSFNENSSSIMSHSMDASIFSQTLSGKTISNEICQSMVMDKCLDAEPVNSPLQALSKMVPVPESLMSPDYRPTSMNKMSTSSTISSPKSARSTTSTKARTSIGSPKSLRTHASARYNSAVNSNSRKSVSPTPSRQKNASNNIISNKIDSTPQKPTSILRKSLSSDDDSVCDSKLQTIQLKAEEKRQQRNTETSSNNSMEDRVEQAAVCIQKIWRGYSTRNKNKEVQEMFKELQSQRANQYIQKLANDMENTKAALESERKIQMLQTEAISALWKKVSAIQPENVPKDVRMTDLGSQEQNEIIKHLAQTCSVLQNQIYHLQSSMDEIVKVMTLFSQAAGLAKPLGDKENGIATQTEISAVHTPQGDAARNFPFQKHARPSSLPLPVSAKKKENCQPTNNSTTDLRQFAGSLVDGVLRTVSETKSDVLETSKTEIIITDAEEVDEVETENSEKVEN